MFLGRNATYTTGPPVFVSTASHPCGVSPPKAYRDQCLFSMYRKGPFFSHSYEVLVSRLLIFRFPRSSADARSRVEDTSVECQLLPQTFQSPTHLIGTPDIDVFAWQRTHLFPLCLSCSQRTAASSPETFTEVWNR